MRNFLVFVYFALTSFVMAQDSQSIEVILTFDDFPMGSTSFYSREERVEVYLEKLSQLDIKTVFFCIGESLEDEVGKKCLDRVAGHHFLANHTYSHPHLSQCSLKEFENEIDKTEILLSPYINFRKWFRFPYLDYGDRSALGGSNRKRCEAFLLLRNKGYQHGYITVNTFDWYVNGLLNKKVAAGEVVNWEHLQAAYLYLLEEWIDAYHERWSRILKMPFLHVLLLHQNDLNAFFLGEVVNLIRSKGWKIVSPESVFEDPIPYLSKFANTKKALFKGVSSLSLEHVDQILTNYEVFNIQDAGEKNETGT